MKAVGVLLGIVAIAVIAVFVINKQKPDSATTPEGKREQPGSSPAPRAATAQSGHPQVEATFKASHGRDLSGLIIDVQIKVQSIQESVNGLRTVLQNQGLDPQGDNDFKEQEKHLAKVEKWQESLKLQYRKALVQFEKFRLTPSEQLQEEMDTTLGQGIVYAQRILNDENPEKKMDTVAEGEFKTGAGKQLWDIIGEVGKKVATQEETLAKLKKLLEDKGQSPDRDPDYSKARIELSKMKRWKAKLDGHFAAALLAYEKSTLNLSGDASIKMEKSLMEGKLYAQNILEGKNPDYVLPATMVVTRVPAKHSARIIQIWNRLERLENQDSYPLAHEVEKLLGRADMRGIQRVDVAAAREMDGVPLKIKGLDKVIWWQYFNGDQRKRSIVLMFDEQQKRLQGWKWAERVDVGESKLGEPKGFADQAMSAFKAGKGSGLNREIEAQLDLVAKEKAELDQFGKNLKKTDDFYKDFEKWTEIWKKLDLRSSSEPKAKLREAFLQDARNKSLPTRAGEAAVQAKLKEGSELLRAIWEEYQTAKVGIANPLPELKVSIAGQAKLTPGQAAEYSGIFKPEDPGQDVDELGLSREWFVFKQGEKFDAAKHLKGRGVKIQHMFNEAGTYQIWLVVRQQKRLVASQAVNVQVVRPRKTQGQVTSVNSQFGIIYIDIGQADTEAGAEYTVRRGLNLVGRLKVGRIQQDKALCRLDKANSPGQPKVGDQVILVE